MPVRFLTNGHAEVTRKSPISGTVNTITMRMTLSQFERWSREGELIQRALPHLSASDREFLMTGITPTEWTKYIKDDAE